VHCDISKTHEPLVIIMKFALAFLATVVVAHSASVSHHGSLREHVPQDAPQNAPAISTTSGKVIGHKAIWPANSGAEEYLGIPYAAPPIRELRFMAPKPFQANGTIKADDFVSFPQLLFVSRKI
jgi:hypothetical protein